MGSRVASTKQVATTQAAQTLRVTGLTVPAMATVGKRVKAEASQFVPIKPTTAEKARVSWCVLFGGKVIERFERHGPVLDYEVPYFLIERPGGLQPHRSPFIDVKDKALAKAKRTPLVHQSLQLKAYTGNEQDGSSKTVALEPNYDRFDRILDSMFDEMTRSARGKDAHSIRGPMSWRRPTSSKPPARTSSAWASSSSWSARTAPGITRASSRKSTRPTRMPGFPSAAIPTTSISTTSGPTFITPMSDARSASPRTR